MRSVRRWNFSKQSSESNLAKRFVLKKVVENLGARFEKYAEFLDFQEILQSRGQIEEGGKVFFELGDPSFLLHF